LPFKGLTKEPRLGYVLGAAAFLALPLEVVSWPSVTPVMVAAALGVLVLREQGRFAVPCWLPIVCALVAAYGCVSAAWSLEPARSFRLGLWLLGTFAAGLVLLDGARRLGPEAREIWARGLIIGFFVGLALLEFMLLTKGRVLDAVRNIQAVKAVIGVQRPVDFPAAFDTAMTLTVFLAWAVIAVLLRQRRPVAALVAAALALAVVAQGGSTTSVIAYVVGILVFAAACLAPRATGWAVGVVLVVWLAAAPTLLSQPVLERWTEAAAPYLGNKESSLAHRLAIWHFVVGKIDERPLLGWGLDSSRWMPGGHTAYGVGSELLPLHPHDGALQIRLDLGLPGVILGMAFVIALMRSLLAWETAAPNKAVALALLSGAAILAAASYDLWHIWWLTMLWLGAVFATAALRSEAEPRPSDRR